MHRSFLPSVALVSALCCSAPAWAQEAKFVTLPDLDIAFRIPEGYRQVPQAEAYPLDIELEGPLSRPKGIAANTNLSFVTGIAVIVLPPDTTGLPLEAPSDKDLKALVNALNQKKSALSGELFLQNAARIKVAGKPSMALLLSADYPGAQEDVNIRLVLVPNPKTKRQYLFLFGATNQEFEEKVKGFDRFMASLRFLSDPKEEPKKPAPKKAK